MGHHTEGITQFVGLYMMHGKSILGLYSIVRGCLGEEPKAEEGRNQGGLGEGQVWENGGIRR